MKLAYANIRMSVKSALKNMKAVPAYQNWEGGEGISDRAKARCGF